MPSTRSSRLGCPQFRALLRRERRAFLKAGVLSMAGLSLADVMRAQANAASAGQPTKRENSVIILWMRGGPSQHETWDPKPDAPSDYRGAFGAMKTNVPGINICDLMPMHAKMQDKYSIIRSLHHDDAGHSSGDQICFTGYPAPKNPPAEGPGNIYPCIGSVVAKQLGQHNPKLPAYVIIPRTMPGTGPAYLGPAYQAFETKADPAQDGPFQMKNFELPDGLTYDRVGGRLQIARDLDRMKRTIDASGEMDAVDQFQRQAWDIVSGPAARAAFDLDAEPRQVRERYGFIPEFKAPTPDRCGVPAWSQRILLARRLVEAGVRLVTVDVRWWDTHVQGVETMRDGFLPRWDRAYTALIEDLHQRGLLQSTMVVAWGEFGRTPKLNSNAGRDHYPNVFSAAVAGGGIVGGRVVGSSDDKGAFPKDRPVTPQEVLATMYRHLGVDVAAHYPDNFGRPTRVLPFGEPIRELF